MRIGEQYEHYRILRLLDRGEFGDVYLAENTRENSRRAALKVVWKGLDEDAQLKQRAEKFGAELQKRLSGRDERIVVVYDYGFDDAGDLYIEMEYIDGQNLSDFIARGTLTPESSADIGEQLCGMLENLGNFSTTIEGKPVSAIVHGDLKPKNIRINTRGQLKVLDFGIAKALSETRTHTQSHWASKAYASPERLDAGNVDMRSDLWSVGVLLYQMISGKLPFDAPTEQLESRIKSYIPPDPLPRTSPEPLSNIVLKLLARDPAKRYLNATEARQDLLNFRAGRPVSAKPIDSAETRRMTPAMKESSGQQAATVRAAAPGIYSPSSQRRPSRGLKPVALTILGIFLIAALWAGVTVYGQYRIWKEADSLRADMEAEHVTDLDAAWKRYNELHRGAWVLGSTWGLRHSLKAKLVALGSEPVSEYRNGVSNPSYDQWRNAMGYLGKALDLDSGDKAVKGRMRLCEGHMDRILGEGRPNTVKGNSARWKYWNTAETRFQEAAELLSRSPDPYLGLARLYTYDLRDIEKAKAALAKAQDNGYPLGNREKAQIADGYLSRVNRTWAESRALAQIPQQEREFLAHAQQDCSSATDLYQQIGAYGRSAQNLRVLIQRCEQVDERLRELDQPRQTQ